jgi:pyruvate dehydrogenase E1 component alpha subunit
MHFTDMANGILGSNGIVGAHLPITVGAALSASHLGTGAVSVAYFGDGASNIGAFHESLNLASVWKLPAIFVLENNQYGEYSAQAVTTPIRRLADRAAAYGMPGVFVDGNDVVTMR